MSYYTTTDLARELNIAPKTVRKRARALGVGIDLAGSAGFRFSEADRLALLDSMKSIESSAPARP